MYDFWRSLEFWLSNRNFYWTTSRPLSCFQYDFPFLMAADWEQIANLARNCIVKSWCGETSRREEWIIIPSRRWGVVRTQQNRVFTGCFEMADKWKNWVSKLNTCRILLIKWLKIICWLVEADMSHLWLWETLLLLCLWLCASVPSKGFIWH